MPELAEVGAIALASAAGRAVAGEIAPKSAAEPVRAAIAAMPAVVVGPEGDLTVVEAGGRLLGIEGLPGMAPGSRLRLALPAGFPSLGGSVQAQLCSGDEAGEPPAVLRARLVTPHAASWPAELRRTADGRGVAARILADAGPAAPPELAPQPGAASRPVEAEIVDIGADGLFRLTTPEGDFVMATAMPGLFVGRRLKLLMVDGDAVAARPGTVRAMGGGPVPGDAAVGLAALVARFSLHGEGGSESTAAHGARKRPANGAGENPGPAADGRETLDWALIPERLPWGDDLVDVLLAPARDGRAGGEVRSFRRMVLALALSRLGDVQLDLGFGEDGIDLVVRTAGPLDAETADAIRTAFASLAACGQGFCGRLAGRLLILPRRSAGQDLVA